nr:phage tail tape measure protein [Providencia rettgeri]
MKELSFLLGLKNNLSAPLGQAQKSVQQFAKSSQDAFAKVGVGVAGLWGVVTGVKSLLNPAHQVQQALDELSTRNVSTQTLDKVYKEAQAFSTAFGKSAADFISSATIIRSEIGGITDDELPRYTKAINTLATASKTSAQDAANYMSEMANNFQSTAKKMGNIPFAEMMASKSAYMVQNFGAGLAEMQELVKSSKNTGTQFGISMDEQFSVMGMLNMTKGTEGGGIYDAFLKSAVEGGQKLGVSLTDAKGQMLAFPDILDKLQNKFGKTIEGNIKVQNALNSAFGDGAQALTAAWGQADKLRQHIHQLGNTQSLDRSTEMAMKMTDMWSRLGAVWERMRVSLGMRLLPAISPLVNKVVEIGTKFAKWMDMFPNITRWLGYITLGVLAFGAAGAITNIVLGVSRFLWMGLLPLWKVGTGALALLTGRMNILSKAGVAMNNVFKWLRVGFGFVRAGAMAAAGGFAAITWPVLAIIAVIAALVVAVVKFWQPIKAFITGFIEGFSDAFDALAPISPAFSLIGDAISYVWQGVKDLFGWFSDLLTPIEYTQSELAGATDAGRTFGQAVAGAIRLMMLPIDLVTQGISKLWGLLSEAIENVKAGWNDLNAWFGNFSFSDAFVKIGDDIMAVFEGVWSWIKESFAGIYNTIASGLNNIPGISLDLIPAPGSGSQLPAAPGAGIGAVIGAGIGKQISNQSASGAPTKKTDIATVNIYPQNQETFNSLLESRELDAG